MVLSNLTERVVEYYPLTTVDISSYHANVRRRCQEAVVNELDNTRFDFLITINFNYGKKLTTFALENSYKLVRDIKNNICSDFKHHGKYFIRPAYSGSWHFHILLQLNSPLRIKNSRLRFLTTTNIKKQSDLDDYARLKTSRYGDWAFFAKKSGLPATKIHMLHLGADQHGAKRYCVYNDHNPSQMGSVDFKRHFIGDEDFLYATNIWKKLPKQEVS